MLWLPSCCCLTRKLSLLHRLKWFPSRNDKVSFWMSTWFLSINYDPRAISSRMKGRSLGLAPPLSGKYQLESVFILRKRSFFNQKLLVKGTWNGILKLKADDSQFLTSHSVIHTLKENLFFKLFLTISSSACWVRLAVGKQSVLTKHCLEGFLGTIRGCTSRN